MIKKLLLLGLISVIFIAGCTQQTTQYVCSDGSAVGSPSLCPSSCTPNWTCSGWSDCSQGRQTRGCADLNNCGTESNKPIESQVCNPTLTFSDISSCMFCNHISVNGNTVTIKTSGLSSENTTSVFIDISNGGETSVGGIFAGVVCSEPKYDLMPIAIMHCWPGLEQGCYVGENQRSLMLSPGKSGLAVFTFDSNKLSQMTASDSISCTLTIASSEATENYSNYVTFNFNK